MLRRTLSLVSLACLDLLVGLVDLVSVLLRQRTLQLRDFSVVERLGDPAGLRIFRLDQMCFVRA